MLQNAPQALGAMTVGGAILGIPLAIISYYLSYAAVDKYQKDIKEKLARQKAKLAGTKEKVKKKMEERKIHKAEVKSQKADK
jgi:membrane protein implicated in regulation of membrane protease activity